MNASEASVYCFMETGPDIPQIADDLTPNQHGNICTQVTGLNGAAETYVVIYDTRRVSVENVGVTSTLGSYRSALYFDLVLANDNIATSRARLCVLHAPFTAGQDARETVLEHALTEASTGVYWPLVLCGDMNAGTQRQDGQTHFESLAEFLVDSFALHVRTTESNLTTLRQTRTIIRTGEITSQPYDQAHESSRIVRAFRRIEPTVTANSQPLLQHIAQPPRRLRTSLENSFHRRPANIDENTAALKALIREQQTELQDSLLNLQAYIVGLRQVPDITHAEGTLLDRTDEWVPYLNAINIIVRSGLGMRGSLIGLNRAHAIIRSILRLVHQILNLLGNFRPRVNAALFRHHLSDHFPVEFVLKLQPYNLRPRSSAMDVEDE